MTYNYKNKTNKYLKSVQIYTIAGIARLCYSKKQYMAHLCQINDLKASLVAINEELKERGIY